MEVTQIRRSIRYAILLVFLSLGILSAAFAVSLRSGLAAALVLFAVASVLLIAGVTGIVLRKPVISIDTSGIRLPYCLDRFIAWHQIIAARIEAMPRGARLLYLDILADESTKQAINRLRCTANWLPDDRRYLRVGISVEGLTLSPDAIHAKIYSHINHVRCQ
jgi:hypothetical protein